MAARRRSARSRFRGRTAANSVAARGRSRVRTAANEMQALVKSSEAKGAEAAKTCDHAFCKAEYLAYVSNQSSLAGDLLSNPVFRQWSELKTGSEHEAALVQKTKAAREFLNAKVKHESQLSTMIEKVSEVATSMRELTVRLEGSLILVEGLCQVTWTDKTHGPFPNLYREYFPTQDKCRLPGMYCERRRSSTKTLKQMCGQGARIPCAGKVVMKSIDEYKVIAQKRVVEKSCQQFLSHLQIHAKDKPQVTRCNLSWKPQRTRGDNVHCFGADPGKNSRYFKYPFACCYQGYSPTLTAGVIGPIKATVPGTWRAPTSKLPWWLEPKTLVTYRKLKELKNDATSKVTALHKQLGTYKKLGVRVGRIKYECHRNRNQMTHETAFICYGTDSNGGQVVVKGFQQELKVLGQNKKKWMPFVKVVSCLQDEKGVRSTNSSNSTTPNSSNSTYDSSESHCKVAKYCGIGKTSQGKRLEILCFQV